MSFRSLLFIFLFSCGFAQAQDSIPIVQRIREAVSPVVHFSDATFVNPANQHFARKYSLSELQTGYENASQKANLWQLGNGKTAFHFGAGSHYKMNSKNTVWGNAGYENGTRKKVRWNESSDYQMIYPYVSADSIGGDLSFEQYNFKGGYARSFNKITVGFEAEYRALLEYRAVDPRPKIPFPI